MANLNSILKSEIIKEYSKRSFYNFFKLFFSKVESNPYVDNYHIKLICDSLQKKYECWEKYDDGDIIKDLLINLPPGSSKSLMVSVFFPAWLWLINPKIKIITASYSHKIAEELSGKSLRLIQSDLYQKICNFKLTSTSVNNIKNNKGGQRFVTSLSGSITGVHADILICDDINSPQSIASEADRESTRKFIQEILPSRKTNLNRSYTIYLQQRLHQQDATGLLLDSNKDNFENIIISAIDENGNSFFPSRFPLSKLQQLRDQLGSVSFNAQYLQRTISDNGGIIKKSWLKEIVGDDKQKLIYFIDTAYGGKNADDNAIIGCYRDKNNLVIQMCERNKYEFPELLNWIKNNIPQSSTIYIEGKASGKSIAQMLRQQTKLNVIELGKTVSKIEEKITCSPFFESGRIFINSYINNKQLLIEQLIFDNLKHDDISDTIMMAINKMLKQTQGYW